MGRGTGNHEAPAGAFPRRNYQEATDLTEQQSRDLQAIEVQEPGWGEWAVLKAWRGSIAHGTYVPPDDPKAIDDRDLVGICVPSPEHYFGLSTFGSKGTKEIMRGQWDIVIFEARKALRLLGNANPNLLTLLWTSQDMHLECDPAGRMLLDHRQMFATRASYNAFRGYALSQLKKMTNVAAAASLGEKRRKLVELNGYDTKNASHMIRILRQGVEFLTEGRMDVYRPDSEELIAIKQGQIPKEKILKMASDLENDLDRAYETSKLPDSVSPAALNELAVNMIEPTLKARTG